MTDNEPVEELLLRFWFLSAVVGARVLSPGAYEMQALSCGRCRDTICIGLGTVSTLR